MEERQTLPNPNLDAGQHLMVLRALAEALDYQAGDGVGYRPIYKILNKVDKTIRSNQIWPALEFFASLKLVQLVDYQAHPAQTMIDWAAAVRDDDTEKAKEIMAGVFAAAWPGQAAIQAVQTGHGDRAGLAQALKQAGGYAANNDDKTLRSIEVLTDLVMAFEVTKGATVISAPRPSAPGADQPVKLPVMPEPDDTEPDIAAPVSEPAARREAAPAPAPVRVPAKDKAVSVQIDIALTLPSDSDEADGRRLGRALRALLDEVGVEAGNE